MGLFTDLYNKVAKFFRSQETSEGESKEVATNRLKLVLMQDRTNLTPKVLEQMRGELIDLLSKYLELDKDLLELNFEQEGDQVALMLAIPVIRAKDEDEIEAAMKLLDDADDVEITEDDEDEDEDEDEKITEVMNDDDEEIISETDSETEDISDSSEESSNEEDSQIETAEDSNVSKPKEMSSSKKENKSEKENATEEITN